MGWMASAPPLFRWPISARLLGWITRWKGAPVQTADFRRPDGPLLAAMGVLIIAAACAGLGFALFAGAGFDLNTNLLVLAGFLGAVALGLAFLNAWRSPMLTVRPDALVLPTAFGTRTIPLSPGHPAGEFLGPSDRGGARRPGGPEANRFVHFYTLDAKGNLTELAALHHAAPEIPRIREALQQVAGLKIETLSPDPTSRRARPDTRHWRLP